MGAAKGRDPLTGAGQQVATGRAGSSSETLVISNVAQSVDPVFCACKFLHDPDAPCYDFADRRAHALGTLYVDAMFRGASPLHQLDLETLTTCMMSVLRMRRRTVLRILGALIQEGMLAVKDCEGAAHE